MNQHSYLAKNALWSAAAAGLALTVGACAAEQDPAEDQLLEVAGADAETAIAAPAGRDSDADSFGGTALYRVTITNLTDNQWLTPPVVATHSPFVALYRAGYPAPSGVREIAENGNLDPLVAALEASAAVTDFAVGVAGDPPPLAPGASVTVEVEGSPFSTRVSVAAMLICSNDGFTGLDAQRLPFLVGSSARYYAAAYDAGSELNTEDFADIVPPCQALSGVSSDDAGTGVSNAALAENGVVHPHTGIDGSLATSDLSPAVHGFSDPVALVEITRVAKYDVTIENLTTTQAQTPPVVATHDRGVRLFAAGYPASEGIREIAENGNIEPLRAALAASSRVSDVVIAAGDPPPLLPGASRTISITSNRSFAQLSFASMLICTNDGFTGVTGVSLPYFVGQSISAEGAGYDAGSEINTEDFADIVPPCQALSGVMSDDAGSGMSDAALAEGGVVAMHPGIDGTLATSDLTPVAHGWDLDAPTTRVTVTRTH